MCECPPCPYGPIILLPLFWVCAGTMYTLFAAFDCDFIRVDNILGLESAVSLGSWTMQDYLGLKGYETGINTTHIYIGPRQTCILWPKNEEMSLYDMDAQFKTSRWCLMIASVLSILLLCCTCRGGWHHFSNGYLNFLTILMLITTFTTGMGLLMLRSNVCPRHNDRCELAFAGIICATATCFWCCAAMSTWYCLRRRYEDEPPRSRAPPPYVEEVIEEEEYVRTTEEYDEPSQPPYPDDVSSQNRGAMVPYQDDPSYATQSHAQDRQLGPPRDWDDDYTAPSDARDWESAYNPAGPDGGYDDDSRAKYGYDEYPQYDGDPYDNSNFPEESSYQPAYENYDIPDRGPMFDAHPDDDDDSRNANNYPPAYETYEHAGGDRPPPSADDYSASNNYPPAYENYERAGGERPAHQPPPPPNDNYPPAYEQYERAGGDRPYDQQEGEEYPPAYEPYEVAGERGGQYEDDDDYYEPPQIQDGNAGAGYYQPPQQQQQQQRQGADYYPYERPDRQYGGRDDDFDNRGQMA